MQHRQRRVTLFTESMRQRGESPEPGFKSIYNQQLYPAGRKAGGLAQQDPMGDLLDLLGDAPAGPGATRSAAGGGQDLAGATGGNAAADVLLLAGMSGSSVEPSITAKAIKRRKAAGAVSARKTQSVISCLVHAHSPATSSPLGKAGEDATYNGASLSAHADGTVKHSRCCARTPKLHCMRSFFGTLNMFWIRCCGAICR
jgi:hypothetical protein